jgi:hypothetical protein
VSDTRRGASAMRLVTLSQRFYEHFLHRRACENPEVIRVGNNLELACGAFLSEQRLQALRIDGFVKLAYENGCFVRQSA